MSERNEHTALPAIEGVLEADELIASAAHLTRLQRPSGMIPWFPGGHCDPWNHVESAMALDVVGFHDAAFAAYRWLVDSQLPNGAWHNYSTFDGGIEDAKLDTNVVAYVATGAWHHWLCTRSRAEAEALWPTVDRALDWVLAQRRDDGLVLWAVDADGTRTWDYALLTGSSSIAHALLCGDRLGQTLGQPRRRWAAAAQTIIDTIVERPEAFEPKHRWAMDWYYPVLSGAMDVSTGKARLADGWSTFVIEGLGVRCVSDEPWITASETAETAIAFAGNGDIDTATDLLAWSRTHRRPDGSYWTGIVYPDDGKPDGPTEPVVFPFEEHTSYTAAAVILAADAITGASPAAEIFSSAEPPLRSPIKQAAWGRSSADASSLASDERA